MRLQSNKSDAGDELIREIKYSGNKTELLDCVSKWGTFQRKFDHTYDTIILEALNDKNFQLGYGPN